MTESTSPQATKETELIALARRGDEQAFGELAKLHRAALTSYCRKIMIVEEDAEDTAQDVLSKAWSLLGQFRGDAPFKRWLFAIARNVCLNARRDNRPLCSLDGLEDMPDTHSQHVADDVVSRVFYAQVLTMVKERAYSQRFPWDDTDLAIFQLRYGQGLEMSEIAAYLGINRHTVRSRHVRNVVTVLKWVGDSLKGADE